MQMLPSARDLRHTSAPAEDTKGTPPTSINWQNSSRGFSGQLEFDLARAGQPKLINSETLLFSTWGPYRSSSEANEASSTKSVRPGFDYP